jgi:hypothetical protein
MNKQYGHANILILFILCWLQSPVKGSPDTAVKLLSCDQEMKGKTVSIILKVVRP